ncbi:hypothetical protein OG785_17295 [Streptomyces sp. NBC_00006]|uniref:hypothetical protein n=1 Tax=Streptomyces sp. NBC_00006 TaxID=2975619 RepID=UPI002252FF2D|nr:hypothetical protein [Streptomyces sp. NBC_00006]MCX5532319.1 hypothetical protein [Streptomyces sp. NBC_00006]
MSERAVRPAEDRAPPRHKEQGPSPWEAERILPLARGQVADRLQELGALYAANCGAEAGQWDRRTGAFLRRLVSDIRRPGFGLLIAENSTMTAYAYGFPLHSGLFEIREIVVPRRARVQSPHQDWNLARRLQRRLLADHGHSTGITLVARADVWTHAALRSWGWRDAPESSYGVPVWPHRTVLLLDP